MGTIEIVIIAAGLSMDAFAVAICKGLCQQKIRMQDALKVGLYFGAAQGLMPVLGYLLGRHFQQTIVNIDHWIAFVLLCVIGGNMLVESFSKEEESAVAVLGPREMLPLALATSIDALAVGITFAFLDVSIAPSAALIGLITFALSTLGFYMGHILGQRFEAIAERLGGIALIIMGVKILLEHLQVFG